MISRWILLSLSPAAGFFHSVPDHPVVLLSLHDQLLVFVLQRLQLLGYLVLAGEITCCPEQVRRGLELKGLYSI
jgi:hypothetical protein